MKMDEEAGSKDDEFFTPLYAVKPIFKYLKDGARIWCPFDTEKSLFVRYGKQQGFKIIHSHLEDNHDFFTTKLKVRPDYIISKLQAASIGKIIQNGRTFRYACWARRII